MALPLVSIILPVWNPLPAWLKIAIESAFQESGCKTEIVLVDDGSNEQPTRWLPAHKDKGIRLIRTPHYGHSHARNVDLENRQGDFVRFLDSDDVILPESISKLLSLIDREKGAVAYGATIICDQDLKPQGIIQSKLNGSIHLQTSLRRFNVTIHALLIPQNTTDQVGKFEERLFLQEDWDYVLRLTEVAKIRGTYNPVYLYRRHQESLTGSGTKNRESIKLNV
jgi:glycosyltransferase involved in cell wall biosynthesis